MREVEKLDKQQKFQLTLTTLILGAVLVAGWMIGSAGAHSTRVAYEYQLQCVQLGGNISNVDGLEGKCVK